MRVIMLSGVLVAVACSGSGFTSPGGSPPVVRLGPPADVPLAFGQTAKIEGGATLTFSALLGDSRCPSSSAICLAEGSADIAVVLGQNGQDSTLDLGIGADGESVAMPGFIFQLAGLTPYPPDSTPIPPQAYQADLQVTVLPRIAGTPMPMTRLIHYGSSPFGTDTTVVVRDSASWAALWNRLHESYEVPPLPTVDFTREMLVGVAMGTRPTTGYDVQLTAAALDRGILRVQAYETEPDRSCIEGDIVGSPFALARVSAVAATVEITIAEATESCGP